DVGLVGSAHIDRLWRGAPEGLAFIQDCRDHRGLIAENGKISDPRDPSAWPLAGVSTPLPPNHPPIIPETVARGIKGKLMAGKAVTHPPVGYEKGAEEDWQITGDLRVRVAISSVFRVYREERSLRATMNRLLELHLEVPFRGSAGVIQFGKPNI